MAYLANDDKGLKRFIPCRDVIMHHPIQERIVIDVGHRGDNRERLIAVAVLKCGRISPAIRVSNPRG